jgi:hypothetical protein
MDLLDRQRGFRGFRGCHISNSVVISREFLHCCRYIAAITASLLAGIRAARARPPFTSAIDTTIHIYGNCAAFIRT